MSENKIQGIMDTTLEKIRAMVDADTVIGEPICQGDITLLPVSKVSFGLASGGSDFPSKNNVELFGGAGGAGITINPVAFLVIKDGDVTIKHIVSNDNAIERAVSLVPEMFDKVTKLTNKKKDDTTEVAE